jgi:type II secretory pathway component PulF
VQASRRYIRLADLLEAGIPLAQAFARARQTLPTDALLATRLASESPNAGAALRMSLVYNGYFTATTRKVLSACLYLFVLVFVGGPVLVFLLSNILPMIERIAFESRVSPASVTPGVLWTQVVLLTPLLLMGLWGFAYSVGWSRHELPWFRRFWLRCDSALVLRALALAVRQSLTIGPAVALLARQYPKASVARRLARSAGEVERGVHRCEALCGAGLIRQVEVAVLRAAERAGNLAWALDEMADSVLRRFTLRLRGVLAVLFPACVVAFGLSMALVGARVVLPIVEMLRACDY